MANYTGAECLVCNEKFNADDDIVVCPQCGTPYHRECYLKEGKCINDQLHEENGSWSKKQDEANEKDGKECAFCHAKNQVDALICESCGASLVDNGNNRQNEFNNGYNNQNQNQNNNSFYGFQFNPQEKCCGMDPEEKLSDDVTISEAADFVGSNVPYYLMLFKRMKDTGKRITLNIICVLFPQFFFAHRKMWLEAVLITIITAVLSIPKLLYSFGAMAVELGNLGYNLDSINSIDFDSASYQLILTITNYISLAVTVLTFLFANWLYFRHMQKTIRNIKSRYSSPDEISNRIIAKGGTSILGVVAIIVLQFILSAALIFSLKMF